MVGLPSAIIGSIGVVDADVNVLTAVADPADYRLSRKFFGRMWRLVRPYWVNRDSRRSWILLIAVLLLIVAGAWMHLLSAEFTRDVTNALVAKRSEWLYKTFLARDVANLRARVQFHLGLLPGK